METAEIPPDFVYNHLDIHMDPRNEHDDMNATNEIEPIEMIEIPSIKQEIIETDSASLYSIVSKTKFTCRLCSFVSECIEEVENHVRIHENEKLYHSHFECRECFEWLLSEQKLRKHFEKHSKSFSITDSVESQRHNDVAAEKASYTKLSSLEHDDGENYPLHDGSNKQLFENELNTSESLLPVEKPFACDQCSHRFIQRHSLIRHLATHSGERNFECEECSKRFITKGCFFFLKILKVPFLCIGFLLY